MGSQDCLLSNCNIAAHLINFAPMDYFEISYTASGGLGIFLLALKYLAESLQSSRISTVMTVSLVNAGLMESGVHERRVCALAY